jgi:DNA invertase Pin-like site-specific DNA recombinase
MHKEGNAEPQGFLMCRYHAQNEDREMIIGYARVSTDGQTLDAQQSALAAAGAEKVFAEKISGAVTDRTALARAIGEVGPGDCLLVTRLDRLARSTKDLLNTLDAIAKAGAGFRSLADAWCDTSSAHGKLMITILGGLAEFERSLILARTSEGRIRAKARGVRFGRKLKLSRHQILEALARREAGEALAEIGRSYNVSPFHDLAISCTRQSRMRSDKLIAGWRFRKFTTSLWKTPVVFTEWP